MRQYKTEIKWALLFVTMLLLWVLLERVAGLHDQYIDKHPIFSNLIMIPALLVYYFALRDKRKKDFKGVMTYKQGFISSLVITVIVTILSPITQCVVSLVITPQYFSNAIAYAVAMNELSQTDAEAFFNLKNYIIQSLMATPILGILTGAIVALGTKSKN